MPTQISRGVHRSRGVSVACSSDLRVLSCDDNINSRRLVHRLRAIGGCQPGWRESERRSHPLSLPLSLTHSLTRSLSLSLSRSTTGCEPQAAASRRSGPAAPWKRRGGIGRERRPRGGRMRVRFYLTESVYNVVLQTSIPEKNRLVLYICDDKGYVDGFVRGFTFAKRLCRQFL